MSSLSPVLYLVDSGLLGQPACAGTRKGMDTMSVAHVMGQKKKILLVDDSKTSLFMELMILKKGPYDLITAADGEEAVRKALAERPDLILLDVVMPKMTGFEACRELRAQEPTKGIPIILVTTRGEEENVETGFAAGCTDYVTKPIDGVELLAKIKSYLGE